MQTNLTRRGFLRNATLAVLAAGLAPAASPQATLYRRIDWATFTQGPDFSSFMDAIKKMKANTNAADKRSWQYWANVHQNFCPHSIPYFLAWHRGFTTLFERQLREVSGNPALALPYWNYYDDPNLPTEFTEQASWNPLFVGRVNNSVIQALTLNPFAGTLVNFQRGLSNSFEVSLESQPHNPIHDLIGGIVDTMQAPIDPIFWLHHSNIDRLWSAWVAAGAGRSQPAVTDPYWAGTFSYAPQLTMARGLTTNTRTNLGYFYDNETLPTKLPTATLVASPNVVQASRAIVAAQALATNDTMPRQPELGSFRTTPMTQMGSNAVSLGGVTGIVLDESSVSAQITLDKKGHQALLSMLDQFQVSPFTRSSAATTQFTAAKVVLSDVRVNSVGAGGGYFYNLYLNLPKVAGAGGTGMNLQFGNLGPFRVSVGMHHDGNPRGTRLEFDITDLLLALRGTDLSLQTFSFVRVSGANAPVGEVISVGSCALLLT
jgi:tyrosinase